MSERNPGKQLSNEVYMNLGETPAKRTQELWKLNNTTIPSESQFLREIKNEIEKLNNSETPNNS